ncbi:MAG: hydroxymyristoyl-ACP dehydratase [Burkholderiales bacterium]
MILNRAQIGQRIPQQGAMCLLERALSWDENHIVCAAISHRDPANPLRSGDILPAVCGIEYAAQAMALHASLSGAGGKPGLLARARDVELNTARLDEFAGELTIRAEKLALENELALYRFSIFSGPRELLRGRLAVMLGAARA